MRPCYSGKVVIVAVAFLLFALNINKTEASFRKRLNNRKWDLNQQTERTLGVGSTAITNTSDSSGNNNNNNNDNDNLFFRRHNHRKSSSPSSSSSKGKGKGSSSSSSKTGKGKGGAKPDDDDDKSSTDDNDDAPAVSPAVQNLLDGNFDLNRPPSSEPVTTRTIDDLIDEVFGRKLNCVLNTEGFYGNPDAATGGNAKVYEILFTYQTSVIKGTSVNQFNNIVIPEVDKAVIQSILQDFFPSCNNKRRNNKSTRRQLQEVGTIELISALPVDQFVPSTSGIECAKSVVNSDCYIVQGYSTVIASDFTSRRAVENVIQDAVRISFQENRVIDYISTNLVTDITGLNDDLTTLPPIATPVSPPVDNNTPVSPPVDTPTVIAPTSSPIVIAPTEPNAPIATPTITFAPIPSPSTITSSPNSDPTNNIPSTPDPILTRAPNTPGFDFPSFNGGGGETPAPTITGGGGGGDPVLTPTPPPIVGPTAPPLPPPTRSPLAEGETYSPTDGGIILTLPPTLSDDNNNGGVPTTRAPVNNPPMFTLPPAGTDNSARDIQSPSGGGSKKIEWWVWLLTAVGAGMLLLCILTVVRGYDNSNIPNSTRDESQKDYDGDRDGSSDRQETDAEDGYEPPPNTTTFGGGGDSEPYGGGGGDSEPFGGGDDSEPNAAGTFAAAVATPAAVAHSSASADTAPFVNNADAFNENDDDDDDDEDISEVIEEEEILHEEEIEPYGGVVGGAGSSTGSGAFAPSAGSGGQTEEVFEEYEEASGSYYEEEEEISYQEDDVEEEQWGVQQQQTYGGRF